MRFATQVMYATAMILTSNAVLAANNDADLASAVREYCLANGQGQSCVDNQLSAAREQREEFMDAFNSRNSEGLGKIAIIARCTKLNESDAGIDYVGIRECMDAAAKRFPNSGT